MKNKLTFFLFLAVLMLATNKFYGQKIWTKLDKSSISISKKEIYEKKNFPTSFKIFSLNKEVFDTNLQKKSFNKNYIELPNANGDLSKFRIKETSNFDIKLQNKYPNIKAYTAQSISNPNTIAKISLGTDGFHAVIFSKKEATLYIDPYTKDKKDYIVYKRNSLSKIDEDFKCNVIANADKESFPTTSYQKTNDGKLRTFRMALACTGEYAQFHLGANQQNIPNTATDAVKKAAILSAMNTSMTRINGVFERELAIKLELVGNNDELIFLDSNTDGMTDDDPDVLLGENQTIVDNTIGTNNYDIGHVFSTSGGSLSGIAVLGSACLPGQKARGVTGLGSPVGDIYDIDLVIHELGHQFGATHTQNNSCNRTDNTAVEPGSGSTIMGYAGICSPNVKSGNPDGNSDDYFHTVSLSQILNLLNTSASCATLTDTNNTAPTADAGANFSIPKSTPFKLTGVATDAEGLSSLTYNWEQIDNEIGTMPPLSTNSRGPVFRSLPSKSVPVRYFPALPTIVSGSTSTTWEALPSVARELNFAFTVRDNNLGGGSTARADIKVDITNAEPFTVTTPNDEISWDTGSTQTITWNKSETDLAPINCSLVNIKLSVDGGVTFPIFLKSNTANDGSEEILIPDNATNTARIMVEAADNIFYNVNDTNFTIRSSASTFVMNNTSGLQTACNSGNENVTYSLNFDFINGFTETVTLAASGLPTDTNVTFNPETLNADGNVEVTISNLNEQPKDDYIIAITGTSLSVNQSINLDLKLLSSEFNDLVLSSPTNGGSQQNLTQELQWMEDTNASSYDVEVATDINFSNIISAGNVTTNSYNTTNTISLTEYFWRVKPKNRCGEGNFSETFSFTTKQAVYCSSTFTDEAGGSEYISNVTFGDINNDSDNDTEDGYQDFTAINTTLINGQQRQISVTFDTAGFQDHCFVFIDWNQDFEFDNATERYDLGTRTEDIATASLTITVPDNARAGNTRMRVVLEYDDPDDGFGEGACDADHLSEWGETEDYSITIIPPLGENNFGVQTFSETCENNNDGIIIIDVFRPADNTYTLSIIGNTTNVSQNLTDKSFKIEDLTPGNYEVCISTLELNTTYCYEVAIAAAQQIALKIAAKNQTKTFSFEISQGTPPFEVFLNDELIGISSNKNFELNINGTGTLKVKTAKECEGFFEKNIDDLLSTENITKTFTVIKNPVTDFIVLNLSSSLNNDTIGISIFDVTGKLVYNQNSKVTSNTLKIPFSSFAKGVYILKSSIQHSNPIKILKQ